MNRAERLRFMAECIEPKIIKEQQGRARVGLIDEYKQDISALIWAAELEDGLRELATEWRVEESESLAQTGGSLRSPFNCADELEALLDEESEDG